MHQSNLSIALKLSTYYPFGVDCTAMGEEKKNHNNAEDQGQGVRRLL
jgi:hypothetical protein